MEWKLELMENPYILLNVYMYIMLKIFKLISSADSYILIISKFWTPERNSNTETLGLVFQCF